MRILTNQNISDILDNLSLEEGGLLFQSLGQMARVKAEKLAEIGQAITSGSSEIPSAGTIVFDYVRMGIMDLDISRCLLEIAKKASIGQALDKFRVYL